MTTICSYVEKNSLFGGFSIYLVVTFLILETSRARQWAPQALRGVEAAGTQMERTNPT